MKRFSFFILLFAGFVPLSPFPALAYDIEGTVRLQPPFPAPVRIAVPKDQQESCGESQLSPRLQISPEGYVANAVIKIEGSFPEKSEAVQNRAFSIDQIGCKFVPHVVLLPQGATLSVLNSEPILHNVRAFDENAKMLFNDAMPTKGLVLKKEFKDTGKIPLRCGVHKWMHALIIVQEHPYYALSDENGKFSIPDIPEGNHSLVIWHEVLGEIRQEVNPQNTRIATQYDPVLTAE